MYCLCDIGCHMKLSMCDGPTLRHITDICDLAQNECYSCLLVDLCHAASNFSLVSHLQVTNCLVSHLQVSNCLRLSSNNSSMFSVWQWHSWVWSI
jgi:hypothetical protein